ncbi:MAG: GGDEF domain-containing protein [Devosia sp.]
MLVFVLLGFAAVALPAYAAFNWVVGTTIVQLGTLFAEKQILYDRFRGLESLMREVSLAETLAGSQAIRDWANDESDADLTRRGIAELEHFRKSFVDHSYFFAMGASGHYYFNDASNAYAGNQLRYTLDPDNPRDDWYYTTAALGAGCHLNVDNDAHLQVTKVWMNCVIREGNTVLGILGTGIDLTAFIREVVNIPQVGVNSMFVDRLGAVQAHRDENLIDLRSLTRSLGDKRTVFSLVDRPEDQAALRQMMDSVARGDANVESEFLQMNGKQVLVGIGYLDKLGWFNVTVMDVDTIIDRRLFAPIGALLAAMMGLVAMVLVLVFKRQVLDRLKQLELAVRRARAGDFGPALAMDAGQSDEVGRLSSAFVEMAVAVSEHTSELENRVRARTSELELLAFRDGQTGIANRRGFAAAFDALPAGRQHGLLLIDIDHFKAINDTFGHAAGDAVVGEVAARIAQAVGREDTCARWGGDEFIVLLRGSQTQDLSVAAHSVMAIISGRAIALPDGRSCRITTSVGDCLIEPSDTIDMACEMADTALYMAKGEGRNRVMIFDRDSAGRPQVGLG